MTGVDARRPEEHDERVAHATTTPNEPAVASWSDRQRALSRRRIRGVLSGSLAIAALALAAYGAVPRRGFVGSFCSDPNLRAEVYRKITPVIEYDWGLDAPVRLYPDGFSIRWTGVFDVPADDIYTFHLEADGGFRLTIDSELLADRWTGDGPTTVSPLMALARGAHALTLEYVDRAGDARISLAWSSTSFDHQLLLGGGIR
jgi:hypothetical protein